MPAQVAGNHKLQISNPKPKTTGQSGDDRKVGLVETMMTADSLRLAACGPDGDEMRIVKDLTKTKTPDEQESLRRQIVITDMQVDALVLELYGLTEDEIRAIEGG